MRSFDPRLAIPAAALWMTVLLALLVLLTLSPAATYAATDGELSQAIRANDIDAVRAHGPDVLPQLAYLYRDEESVATRAQIAWIFYRLGWPSVEARDALLADVHTDDETLRLQVQYALSRVSSDEVVVDVLLENLQHDTNPLFRDKAACSLANDQIHLTETQRVRLFRKLIDLLEAPDGETRSLAIRVLQQYTGQAKGFHPGFPLGHRLAAVERWRTWVAEYEREVL